MPCVVKIYDCMRAWANPQSTRYGCCTGRNRSALDVHEYYYNTFQVVQSEKATQLMAAQEEVDKLIREKSFGPLFVRFAWHDSGTFDNKRKSAKWPSAGGAIGSIIYDNELNAGPNAGLRSAYNVLGKIKAKYAAVGWADLIQLASARSIELMGGPKIDMKYGRRDAVDSPPESVAPFGLPDAKPQNPASHLREVFYKYDMNDEDIVALSGAHTIGRAFKDRSGAVEFGYQKPTDYTKPGCPMAMSSMTLGGQSWTKEWLKFDNSYFQLPGNSDNNCVVFPTDAVLATDPKFKPFFDKFAKDQNAFFASYAKSHKKLSELGSHFEGEFSI